MTEAFDLTRQARWEVEGTRRAAERYLTAAAVADPTTLPSGQRLLREVIPPLTAAIELHQREALERATGRGGTQAWDAFVHLLDAQTFALITVCSALRSVTTAGREGATITATTKDISARIRDELEYRTWVQEQKEANTLAKEGGDREHRNLLAAFKAIYPTPNPRVWRTWSRRVEAARIAEWDERAAVQYGGALLQWLVETSGGRVELP